MTNSDSNNLSLSQQQLSEPSSRDSAPTARLESLGVMAGQVPSTMTTLPVPVISNHELPVSLMVDNEDFGTFTLFKRLPLELRRKMWRSAFPGPRIIYTWEFLKMNTDLEDLTFSEKVDRHHANSYNLMKVCREFKEVVLERYEIVPAATFTINTLPNGAAFLFDYGRDCFYVYHPYFLLDDVSAHDPGRISVAALDPISFVGFMKGSIHDPDAAELFREGFGRLKNLKSIVLDARPGQLGLLPLPCPADLSKLTLKRFDESI